MAGNAGGVIRITAVADDKATGPLSKLQGKVEELQRGFDDATGAVSDAAKSFLGLGGASLTVAAGIGVVVAAISAAAIGFSQYASEAIKAADDNRKLSKSFKALIGDTQKTEETLQALQDFAGFTAFKSDDIKEVALGLLQAGVAADELIPTLAGLGGAAQGNTDNLKALASQFQTLADTPKATVKSLRGFATNGVDALQLLAEATNQTKEQLINNFNSMNMSGADAARLLLAKSAEKFGSAMLQDVENIDNLLARAADSAGNAQEALGNALEPLRKVSLKAQVDYFNGLTQFFKDTFDNPIFARLFGQDGSVSQAISNISEMMGPVMRVLGQLGVAVAVVLGHVMSILGVVAKMLTPLFKGIEKAVQPAFEVFMELFDLFQAIYEIVIEAASAFSELLTPIFGVVGEFNILSTALRFIASMLRTATEYLRAFGKLLKPLWDWLRSVANIVKDAADGIRTFFASLGLGPKAGADGATGSDFFKDALLNLIPVIGPVITLVQTLLEKLGLIPPVKKVDVQVNVPNLGDVNANVNVNVNAPNVSVVDNLKAKLAELLDKKINIDVNTGQSQTNIEKVRDALLWYKPEFGILFTASTVVATVLVEKFQQLLGNVPAEVPTTVTVTTEPAMTQVSDFNANIRNIPTVETTVGIRIADASRELLKYISDMFTVPLALKTGFSLAFGNAFAELANWSGALNAIPRMITTVVNTIQGKTEVADQQAAPATQFAGEDIIVDGSSTSRAAPITSGGAGDVAAGAIILGGAAIGIGAGAGLFGGCFVGDTLVSTPNGYVPIEQLVVGQYVTLYTVDGVVVAAPIAEVFVFDNRTIMQIITSDAKTGGYWETIEVTGEHPFAVVNEHQDIPVPYEFIRAANLQVGMELRNAYGRSRRVHSIRMVGYTSRVYNLEVDHPDHTYLVGKFKHVVHNRKGSGGEDWLLLASGGIVMKPTPAIVGEAGPEAVIPLGQLNDMLGGGGGVNIASLVINVAGSFSDPVAAGASAADAFRRQLGLQRRMLFQTT